MNARKLIEWAGLCLLAALSLRAQELTPPKAPFVIVPQMARWEVTMRPLSATKDRASEPEALVQSVISGDLKRDVFVIPGQKSREVWYRGGMMFLSTDDNNYAVAVDPKAEDSGIGTNVLYAPDFPGVSWIDAKSFRGSVEKDGTKCLFFEKEGTPPLRAWIDEVTRRPLVVELGSSALHFSFQCPPSTPLMMPGPYEEAWKRFRALADRRKAIQNAGN